MSLTLIPWMVLVISTLVALHLPLGRDFAVPMFLVPWAALEIDVGVGITLSQFILIVLALKYALKNRLNPGAIPSPALIVVIIAVGVFAAVVTFSTHSIDIVFAGGELRNGPFRTVVVLVVFLLAIIPFALINARGARFSVIGLLKVYVISVLILCALGVLQYLVFQTTGNDLFPIGVLGGDPELYRSGMFQAFGGWQMRPSSLAGEPKGLAMVTASATVLIMAFGERMFRTKRGLYGAFLLCVVIIVLTQSTSAFLSFGLGIGVFFGLRSLGRPLKRSVIRIGYFVGITAITSIYFYNVATIPLDRDYDYANELVTQSENYLDLMYQRSLGRMNVEDMDWVIIKSFQEDLSGLVLGRGFGLGHLFTDPYIPERNWYMIGTLNSPKSGITLFLVNGGILSLILFIFFLAKITPAADDARLFQDPAYSDYIRRAQAAFVALVIMFMLRTYVFEEGLMLMAVMSVALRLKMQAQRRPMAAGSGRPQVDLASKKLL